MWERNFSFFSLCWFDNHSSSFFSLKVKYNLICSVIDKPSMLYLDFLSTSCRPTGLVYFQISFFIFMSSFCGGKGSRIGVESRQGLW